jgi:hypothetical protein
MKSKNEKLNSLSIVRGSELELETMKDGLKSLDPTTQFMVDGVLYTPVSLEKRIDAELAPFKAVRNAKIMVVEAIAERRERTKGTKQFIADARFALQGAFGSDNAALAKFGIKQKKDRQPETLEEKLARFSKAKATRAEKKEEAPPAPSP